MSEMEFALWRFRKSERQLEPRDDDDYYDLEEELGVQFVKVQYQLYEFQHVVDVEPYGFIELIPPLPEDWEFYGMGYWYNGGAGSHEVAADVIQKWLTTKT